MPEDLLSPLPTPPTPAELEAQQFEAVTAPAADPNSYNLQYHGGLADGFENAADLQEVDADLRNLAKDCGLPAHIGGSILRESIIAMQRFNELSDPEKAVYLASQRALLGRLLPGVTADQIVAGAEAVLKRANPEVLAGLRENGFFSSASTLAQFYCQSLRDAARGLK